MQTTRANGPVEVPRNGGSDSAVGVHHTADETATESRPEILSRPLVICEHCDSVYQRVPLVPGGVAECPRCGAALYRRSRFGIQAMIALAVAGLVVFLIANAFPIVSMESGGVTTSGRLITIVAAAWTSGIGFVAAIAATTVFLFPLMQLGLYLFVLLPLSRRYLPANFSLAMRWLRWMRPWSMVEVFLIGILVSIIKMSSLAAVSPEPGLWGFALLTLLLTALGSFELRELWDASEGCEQLR